jgi:hypothetical protein
MSIAVAIAIGLGLAGAIVAVRTLSVSGEETAVGFPAAAGQSQAAQGSPADDLLTKVVGISHPTSFGVVAVTNVETIDGVTAKAVSGVTHGVHGLVRRGRMQVEVSVELSNTRSSVVRYDPRQFQLRVGPRRILRADTASIRPGALQPGAAIGATLGFVGKAAPQQTLVLEMADRGPPVRIVLGPAQAFGSVSTKPDPYAQHGNHK